MIRFDFDDKNKSNVVSVKQKIRIQQTKAPNVNARYKWNQLQFKIRYILSCVKVQMIWYLVYKPIPHEYKHHLLLT